MPYCFIVEVYTVLINCFLREKVGGCEKSQLLGGSEKNRLLNGVENGLADVTDTVRSDHRLLQHKLQVLFTTGQWHSPPRSAATHAMSQPAAVAIRLFLHFTRYCGDIFRWSGKIYSQLVSSFLGSLCTKNYWNRFIFYRVIPKIKRGTFFLKHGVLSNCLIQYRV